MTVPAPAAGNNRVFSGLRRCWGLALIAVTAILVAATQPFSNGPVIRADGYAYHAWTYAILRGDLNFHRLENETFAFNETRPGYYWNSYPPGVALARLPVMAWLADRKGKFGSPTRAEHAAIAVLSALALIGTAALLFYTCRVAGAGNNSANVAVLAVVFGTGLFHYATYDAGYSHVWSALGLATLAARVARSLSRGGRIAIAAIVLLAAWLVLVRNTNVFALAILGGSYLILAPRQLNVSRQVAVRQTLWLAAGIAAGTAVQLALNSYAHGKFTLVSYHGPTFNWDRPMQWSVLTSVREHGLLAVLSRLPAAGPSAVCGSTITSGRVRLRDADRRVRRAVWLLEQLEPRGIVRPPRIRGDPSTRRTTLRGRTHAASAMAAAGGHARHACLRLCHSEPHGGILAAQRAISRNRNGNLYVSRTGPGAASRRCLAP